MSEPRGSNQGETHKSAIRSVVNELMEISTEKNDERSNRQDESGDSFNIFEVLNMMTNEVNGHSRFLHELLSPNGSHGMKSTFLTLFFEKVLGISPEPWLAGATVEREFPFDDGRIDLLIKKPGECCIVIEVKIYASDQYRQIARYYDFIEREHPDDLVKGVYYLTLDGHEPDEFSVGEGGAEYTCLSFKTDIIPWLKACAEVAREKPGLCEAIKQYLDVLEDLVGGAKMDEEMQYVADKVADSSVSYEAAVQIANALPEARTNLMKKIFSSLETYLEERISRDSNLTSSKERKDIEDYYGYIGHGKRPWPRLRFKLREDGDRILALVIELDWRLYMGVAFFKSNSSWVGFERIDAERDWLYSLGKDAAWRDEVDSAPKNDWWIDWQYLDSGAKDADSNALIDFRHYTNGYSALYDKAELNKRISEWKKRIGAYLEKIEDEFGIAFRPL